MPPSGPRTVNGLVQQLLHPAAGCAFHPWDLAERWDTGVQGYRLWGTARRKRALGMELGYLAWKNLWLAAGYNVKGFAAGDLAGDAHAQQGAYLRLRLQVRREPAGKPPRPRPPIDSHARTVLILRRLLLACALGVLLGSRAAGTGACSDLRTRERAGHGARRLTHLFLPLDFTDYNDATARSTNGQTFTFNLPDGTTVAMTLKVSGDNPALTSVAVPSWSGSAFGNTAFLGIPGKAHPVHRGERHDHHRRHQQHHRHAAQWRRGAVLHRDGRRRVEQRR